MKSWRRRGGSCAPFTIFDGFSVFVYLDQKGWRYYLPAALSASLRNPGSLCEFYTRISVLRDDQELQANGARRAVEELAAWLGLNSGQGRVVARTLSYIRELNVGYYESHRFESDQIDEWARRYDTEGG